MLLSCVALTIPPTESRDSLVMWSCDKQKELILHLCYDNGHHLARCDFSWAKHNWRVTWLTYHVITLCSEKDASPVWQFQWPLNFVGLWVRVKGPQLRFQVTCRSSDPVLCEKCHVSTNARPQNSARDIKLRKTHKSKAFFGYSKDINIWFTSIYTVLNISKLSR